MFASQTWDVKIKTSKCQAFLFADYKTLYFSHSDKDNLVQTVNEEFTK
jgi:hypothetical protein